MSPELVYKTDHLTSSASVSVESLVIMNPSRIDSMSTSNPGVVLRVAESTSLTPGDVWTTGPGGVACSVVGSTSGPSRRKREPLLGLIVSALREAGSRGLVLTSIYRYVIEHSADYAEVDSSGATKTSAAWRKNVRHILSVRNFFVKTAEQNPDGRGRFWRLDEVKYAEFLAERNEPPETFDRQPANAAPSRGDVDNYMASVQSLSALSDDVTVTSFPLSTRTADQYVDQSRVHGQYVQTGQGYCLPAYWQYDGRAQRQWNVMAYDGQDWPCSYPRQHAHQCVNGFGQSLSAWHRGSSNRYHPYAGAMTTARVNCRPPTVGVGPSSSISPVYTSYPYNGVDHQRAPAQSYSHSLGGAAHNSNHPLAYDAGHPQAYVTYPTHQDYVTSAYADYQLSSPSNDF